MTASQRAKQKCATKQNKPATNSEAANCCCMVAPWEVIEEGRGYHLEVTEVGKGKGLNGTEIDVSKKLEYSNKEDKKFELHIVAPPADKYGKVTYKKVTSKHKFLKKECDLKMLVKSGKIEKSIPEGGSFEIDTNGNIKGAMGGNCEQEADKERRRQEAALKHVENYNKANKAYEDQVKVAEANIKTLKEQNAPPKTIALYEKATSNEILKKIRDDSISESVKDFEAEVERINAEEVKSYMDTLKDEEELSDLEIIFKALFNPKSISKKIIIRPIGSKKCNSQPTVQLFVYPFIMLDGGFSLMYTKAKKTKISSSAKLEINQAKMKVSGKLNMYYGSKTISYGGSVESGGGSYERKVKPHERRRKQKGKSIFTTMESILNFFKDAEDAKKQYDKRQGRSLPGKFKFLEFDPGKTGFSVTIKKYELKEIKDKHQIDYANNVSLTINILNGVSIKADIIELLIVIATIEAPFVGDLLSRARDAAEKGIGGERANLKIGAKVDLSINGGISVNFSWDKKLEKEIQFDKTKIVGTIGFKAEALIYSEGKLLFVTIKGEAGVKAASQKNVTTPCQVIFTGELKYADNKILLSGGIDFTGLSLYYVLNGDISIQRKSKSSSGGFGARGKGPTQKASIAIGKYKNSDKIPIFEEWKPSDKNALIDLEQFLD